jgi:hypothetical protein
MQNGDANPASMLSSMSGLFGMLGGGTGGGDLSAMFGALGGGGGTPAPKKAGKSKLKELE